MRLMDVGRVYYHQCCTWLKFISTTVESEHFSAEEFFISVNCHRGVIHFLTYDTEQCFISDGDYAALYNSIQYFI